MEGFYRDDDVTAAVLDMGELHIEELRRHGNGFVVHELQARRIDAGLEDLVRQGQRFGLVPEDTDHVEVERRQGAQFNRHFRDDAQGPLGSGKKLFQGQARGAFL